MADTGPSNAVGTLDMDALLRGALPQTTVDVPKAQAGLKKVAEDQAKETAEISDRTTSRVEGDRQKLQFAEAGIGPVPDDKWDADKERKKYSTDPMEAFGSFGFIALTLASAFTRQPMINMMNSAGAYLGAINDKNSKDYDRAYDAFKENAQLAMKRHEMQREAYDDAMKLLSTDVSAGRAELQAAAAKFGDKRVQALAEAGMDEELQKYLDSQRNTFLGIARMMPEIEREHIKKQTLSLDPDYQSGDPKRMAQAEVRLNRQETLTPDQQIWDTYRKEHPDADSKEQLEFYKELKAFGAKTTLDAARRDEIYKGILQDWRNKHPGEEPSADVKRQANLEAMGKSGKIFDDSSLDTMTDLYLGGNKSVLTNVGRGVQGPENLDKFWTTLSKKMNDRGYSAEDINRAQIEYTAAAAGARVLAQRAELLKLASNEADTLIPRVRQISDRIDRTKFPSINSLILAAQRGTGGEDVIRLGVAVRSLIPVYSRILKPTGVITVDDNKRSEEILNESWSKGQINAALDQMIVERDSAAKALDKTIAEGPILSGIHGPKKSSKTDATDAPPDFRYDAQGNKIQQ